MRLPLRLRASAAGLALLGVVAGCGSSATPSPSPTAIQTPAPSATATATANPCAVPQQAAPPPSITADFVTALAFAPDGRLFYTERSGRVMVWQNGAAKLFATVPTVTVQEDGSYSERGLLGLAISPTFAQDRYVYAFYSDTDYKTQHVIRWKDCAGTGTNAQIIITLPSGPDCCHKGGRIMFGTDGKLYVSLGDEHTASAAQNTSDVRGKILRYNPDGSVPSDNPFGANNPVWAYGLRNVFGFAFSPSGQLAVTSNGPSGDAGSPSTGYDTFYLDVTKGEGFQWPLCYGYSHPLQSSSCGGRTAPDWSSEQSTVVPTGVAWIDSAAPAPYAGHVVFCTFNYGMRIVTPGSPHATVSDGPSTCRLDVVEGPNHMLYVSDLTGIHEIT